MLTRIPNSEYQDRARRVQQELTRRKLDGLLAFATECEPANARYLSDYWPSFETTAVLVPRSGEPSLLIGPESRTFATATSRLSQLYQLIELRESSQPAYPNARLDTWEAVLGKHRIRRLGIAGYAMLPLPVHQRLAAVLGADALVDADDLLLQLRMIKSANEVKLHRQAYRLAERGLARVLATAKPGMTEVQIAAEAEYGMLSSGADCTGYPIWCCSGPNSNQAISRPTHRKIRVGEVVQLCCGARFGGYASSIGRPFVLGKMSRELRRLLEVGLAAEELTIATLRGGILASEVAKKVHAYIREQGYGEYILYGPAHGVGLMECEYPFIETSLDMELQPNMMFNIDIFLGKGNVGLRFEDGVRITATGVEELSSHRREVLNLK
jgi:Xaa-Pro aminopeptidase